MDRKNNEQLLNEWIVDMIVDNVTRSTVDQYVDMMRRLAKETDNKSFYDITYNDIRDFLSKRNAASTRNKYQVVVIAFYKWMVRSNYITEEQNPYKTMKTVKDPIKKKKQHPFLSEDDMKKLIDYVKSNLCERDKILILTYANTGLRLSEVLEMKAEDFNFRGVEMDGKVFYSVKVLRKGNKEQVIYLDAQFGDELKRYIKNSGIKKGYIFVSNKGKTKGQRISRAYVQGYLCRKIEKGAGIEHLHIHLLRHTFATNYANGGGSLRILQEILGHENSSTTEIYVHEDNRALLRDMARHAPCYV